MFDKFRSKKKYLCEEVKVSVMEDCDFALYSNEPCNKLTHTRRHGILEFNDFEDNTREIYLWRAAASNVKTICLHHKAYYGQKFEERSSNQKCCNLFQNHKRKNVKGKYSSY